MASDVAHPERKLPTRWKARLHDQPPLQHRQGNLDEARSIGPDESPINVVIEPTEPTNAHGLPAFRIKQEIEPQPTDVLSATGPIPKEMRGGILVATIIVALLTIVVLAVAFVG